jgi:ABC-type transporter MlaC component
MKIAILALAVAFQSAAFAAAPADAVKKTIGDLMEILNGANQVQKIAQLCTLVKSDLDTAVIGSVLLGSFQSVSTDTDGVRDFKAQVPSIIMDQFYGLLHDKGGSKFTIGGTVPKGSGKVGVKVVIGTTNFVVTVLRATNKIVDVEWNNFSLVNTKRDEFQRELADFHTDKPVSALVDSLNNKGVNKCN